MAEQGGSMHTDIGPDVLSFVDFLVAEEPVCVSRSKRAQSAERIVGRRRVGCAGVEQHAAV